MIDENRTLEIYGYTSDELKRQSGKPIVAVCDGCGKYRDLPKQQYRELCVSCSRKKYYEDPEHCAKTSNSMMGHSVSEETRAAISAAQIGIPKSPEFNAAMSEIITNSEAAKANWDVMHGGNDIVWHHTLYDHSDLSKNRVPMTRRSHTMGHHVLQALGIKIPHINMEMV